MTTTDQLVPILKKLRLSGLLETLDIRRRQAVDDHLSFDEFLLRLLMDEVERRDGKQLRLRLRRAQFDGETTLESFDFAHSPQLPKTRIIDLATCAFIHRQEAALLIGPREARVPPVGGHAEGVKPRHRQDTHRPGHRPPRLPPRPHHPLHFRRPTLHGPARRPRRQQPPAPPPALYHP